MRRRHVDIDIDVEVGDVSVGRPGRQEYECDERTDERDGCADEDGAGHGVDEALAGLRDESRSAGPSCCATATAPPMESWATACAGAGRFVNDDAPLIEAW